MEHQQHGGNHGMLDALSQAEMFEGIPLDGLVRLARSGIKRSFSVGTVLMRQGDVSETMYVILRGKVHVERSHPQLSEAITLAVLGLGEVVGEMGLLDREPRSATVTALEDVEAMELDDLALAQTILQYPEVSASLLRLLSRRLRSADELSDELRKRAVEEEEEEVETQ
jgi:CRP/FNR family transcriptional regulator, cyclic AMP receptor protein